MKILVYGSLEFGEVVKYLVLQCGHEFVGFIDDYSTGGEILGTFAEVVEKHPADSYGIVIAIGYKHLKARWDVFQRVQSLGYRSPALIHPKAYVRETGAVGPGAMVMAGAIVDIHAQIGAMCVLWPAAVVNHNSNIGANTFLSPNSTVCGHVQVGENSFVGAGAVIVDHVSVPADAFIKAGTVYFVKQ